MPLRAAAAASDAVVISSRSPANQLSWCFIRSAIKDRRLANATATTANAFIIIIIIDTFIKRHKCLGYRGVKPIVVVVVVRLFMVALCNRADHYIFAM